MKRNRAALVIPAATATPNATSATSASEFRRSAFARVGSRSKAFLSLNATTPKAAPVPAASPATPAVRYAGKRLCDPDAAIGGGDSVASLGDGLSSAGAV